MQIDEPVFIAPRAVRPTALHVDVDVQLDVRGATEQRALRKGACLRNRCPAHIQIEKPLDRARRLRNYVLSLENGICVCPSKAEFGSIPG